MARTEAAFLHFIENIKNQYKMRVQAELHHQSTGEEQLNKIHIYTKKEHITEYSSMDRANPVQDDNVTLF